MGCFSMINPDDYLYLVVFTKRRMHFFTGGYLFTCKYWQHAKTGTYTWVPISGLVVCFMFTTINCLYSWRPFFAIKITGVFYKIVDIIRTNYPFAAYN